MTNKNLVGQIKSPQEVIGFDTNTIISADTAIRFFEDGYRFCLRYIGRTKKGQNDLSIEEVNNILNAGLGLMPVQHVKSKPKNSNGWTPSVYLGNKYGEHAAKFARELGFPSGVNVWCDLEGIDSKTSSSVVIAYCQAWYKAVHKEGFAPGLYVGSCCRLSSEQLYHNLPFKHYWKSGSNVPDVDKRGYQMIQTIERPSKIKNGISIDENQTITDHQGGQVKWLEK